MASPGAKPKPEKLRLVTGTHNVTRHGAKATTEKTAEICDALFGKLEKPAYLSGEAEWAWDRYVKPAAWLNASRESIAIAFCEIWQEYRSAPSEFPASKHAQMRAYLSELGLTDERNRGDMPAKAEKDEFFGD